MIILTNAIVSITAVDAFAKRRDERYEARGRLLTVGYLQTGCSHLFISGFYL